MTPDASKEACSVTHGPRGILPKKELQKPPLQLRRFPLSPLRPPFLDKPEKGQALVRFGVTGIIY